MSKKGKKLRVLMEARGAKQSGNTWVFSRAGYIFEVKHKPSGEDGVIHIGVYPESSMSYPEEFVPLSEGALREPLECDVVPGIVFSRESDLTRLGKKWGFDRELQVGDRRFDNKVYIETNVPSEMIHPMCMNADFRQAILRLFEIGLREVEVFCKEAPVWVNVSSLKFLHEDVFQDILDALVTITKSLPPLKVKDPSRTSLRARGYVTKASVVSAVVGGFLFLVVPQHWDPLNSSVYMHLAVVGLVMWGAGLVVLLRYFSRYSGGFRVVAAYGSAGLVGGVLVPMYLFLLVNGLLDSKDPEVIPTVVTKTSKSKDGDDNFTYWATYTVDYQGVSVTNESEVPVSLFRELMGSKDVNVSVSPGLFGVPWVSDISMRGK